MIDKQNSLKGKILLAMPGLSDSLFSKSVIFICAHDEHGAMGYIINNTLPSLQFEGILKQLDISDVTEKLLSRRIYSGGPVDPSRGFLLHDNSYNGEGTNKINDEFSVTVTLDGLADINDGKGPARSLFILGYAGWDAGQLEQELQDNSWQIIDATPSIVFETQPDDMWSTAFSKLGIDLNYLSSHAGQA